MNKPSFEEVLTLSKVESEYLPILEKLYQNGMTVTALDLAVSKLLGKPITDPQVSIARMNLIGGLRASGIDVSGGRSGGAFYRIIGWREVVEKTPVDQWRGLSRDIYEQVHSLRALDVDSETIVRLLISFRDKEELLHENCFLYPWAYEGARAQGFLKYRLSPDPWGVIIFQRFRNYPQFRIFHLVGRIEESVELAQWVAPASMKKVQIINVPPSQADLKRFGWGELWPREEGVYDLKDIAEHPEKYLNKRAITQFRARQRDTQFSLQEPALIENNPLTPEEAEQAALSIIDQWQEYNEPKHRQLAITRDRIAVKSHTPNSFHFLGYRCGSPVIHHLLESIPNRSDSVSLINEKSLNYRGLGEGGHPGLSDFNQVMTARSLVEMGYQFEQSGGLDGGGVGLEHKKRKYACEIRTSYTLVTNFSVSEYAV